MSEKKPEQLLWSYLDRLMRGFWLAERHEDKFKPDIADVSFDLPAVLPGHRAVRGWIELKSLPGWPKKGGPVNIRHLTGGQRRWLVERGRVAGHAFLLGKAGADYFLLRADQLDHIGSDGRRGEWTQADIEEQAHGFWKDTINPHGLTGVLSKPYPCVMVNSRDHWKQTISKDWNTGR